MLRGKEAAPVRIYSILYIIYIMLSGIEKEREKKKTKKRETESIKNAKRGTSIASIVSDRESSVVLKEKLLLYSFIIKCRCQIFFVIILIYTIALYY